MLTFSVITPSFNQGQFIRQSIESVVAQKYPHVEHLVMDGGSTDETVSILREYPHLRWQSEPDRGQSHALNVALGRISGDIVAVMNADDWYAPNVFHEVAGILETEPLVMGRFELIDAKAQPMYQVANVERSWFDLMRYWVPYSTPPHPSLFVRRDALDSIRLPNGQIIDEDFYYAMDYELWLRLAAKYPFGRRIDRVLFYYRMTEDNKTSHDIDGIPYAEPELSRAFRRSEAARTGASRRVTVVVAVADSDPKILTTVESALAQDVEDVEVLVVDYSGDKKTWRALRKMLAPLNESQRTRRSDNYAHHVVSTVDEPGAAIERAIGTASGAVILFVEPGAILSSSAVRETIRIFSVDRVAAALPAAGRSYTEIEADPLHFTTGSKLPPAIAFRRIALLEFGEFPFAELPDAGIRWLLPSLVHRGWSVSCANELQVTGEYQDAELCPYDCYIEAQAISDIADQIMGPPFGTHRANFGVGVPVTQEQVARARQLLVRGGPAWHRTLTETPPRQLPDRYPEFAPGWYRAAVDAQSRGEGDQAREYHQEFLRVRAAELELIGRAA